MRWTVAVFRLLPNGTIANEVPSRCTFGLGSFPWLTEIVHTDDNICSMASRSLTKSMPKTSDSPLSCGEKSFPRYMAQPYLILAYSADLVLQQLIGCIQRPYAHRVEKQVIVIEEVGNQLHPDAGSRDKPRRQMLDRDRRARTPVEKKDHIGIIHEPRS